MNMHLKRKIAFALLMGIVTTGIISFVLLALNIGFSETFALSLLRSWAVGYVIVIPAILVTGATAADARRPDRSVSGHTDQG